VSLQMQDMAAEHVSCTADSGACQAQHTT
jgi:hypothetical protein